MRASLKIYKSKYNHFLEKLCNKKDILYQSLRSGDKHFTNSELSILEKFLNIIAYQELFLQPNVHNKNFFSVNYTGTFTKCLLHSLCLNFKSFLEFYDTNFKREFLQYGRNQPPNQHSTREKKHWANLCVCHICKKGVFLLLGKVESAFDGIWKFKTK